VAMVSILEVGYYLVRLLRKTKEKIAMVLTMMEKTHIINKMYIIEK
jgi:hypothetical protein